MQGRKVVRHLVRFGQKGSYQVPPMRYWRMYQPQDKAFQAVTSAQTWKIE